MKIFSIIIFLSCFLFTSYLYSQTDSSTTETIPLTYFNSHDNDTGYYKTIINFKSDSLPFPKRWLMITLHGALLQGWGEYPSRMLSYFKSAECIITEIVMNIKFAPAIYDQFNDLNVTNDTNSNNRSIKVYLRFPDDVNSYKFKNMFIESNYFEKVEFVPFSYVTNHIKDEKNNPTRPY